MSGHTWVGGVAMVTEECCNEGCGVTFGLTADLQKRRFNDHKNFYCPNGHSMVYTGKTDAQKLKDAQARETGLRDQLAAATREAEATKAVLLRDRARFANGVCPCCTRSFQNVRRHMETQHPDYDVTKVKAHTAPKFECQCGRSFETLHGLHIHQSRMRKPGWDAPRASWWVAHLTVVPA